ncbi:MAG: hypothetical protein P8Q97_04125 [Myxococcota bacterium]|nr:hypothetical protein [Myxococcota bacterium]
MTFVEQVKVPPQAVAQLVELGYAEATFDINSELSGVVVSDLDRALPGVNLYNSRTAKSAQLIDLAGAVIHEWKYETPDAWQSVDLLPGGGLLVVEKDRALHFLDAESHLLWSFPGEMHHDLDVFEGEIYALNRQIESRPGFDEHAGVLVDFVSVIAFDGTEKREFQFWTWSRSPLTRFFSPALNQASGIRPSMFCTSII